MCIGSVTQLRRQPVWRTALAAPLPAAQSAKLFRTPTLIALTASVAPIIGRSIAT